MLLLGLGLFNAACSSISPKNLKNLSGPGVELQDKKIYKFKDQQVYFSNRFDGSRLNDVTLLNDSTFAIRIKPENEPINPSPWYAFQMWSKAPRSIHIVLDYGESKHRYSPHVRQASGQWLPLGEVQSSEDRTDASFSIQVNREKKFIAGQPMFNKDSILHWLDVLDNKPGVRLEKIGKSTLGETMLGLHTSITPGKKAIAVLGGQHPPEITGYQAQIAFLNFMLGDDPLAKRFRERFQIVAVPWINPDGNNQGHWRHNVAGVDLNRDWTTFNQKETTATRDYFLHFKEEEGVDFVFGVDFHSTFRDVLYTNNPHPEYVANQPGIMSRWIQHWNAQLGDLAVKEEPSDANGRVSKSWFLMGLQAEGVTYEVGDLTPVEEIHYKARQAAISLIHVLLDEN